MRYIIGFLTGLATAYAALSIWHRLPAWTEDLDYRDDPQHPIDRGYGLGA